MVSQTFLYVKIPFQMGKIRTPLVVSFFAITAIGNGSVFFCREKVVQIIKKERKVSDWLKDAGFL